MTHLEVHARALAVTAAVAEVELALPEGHLRVVRDPGRVAEKTERNAPAQPHLASRHRCKCLCTTPAFRTASRSLSLTASTSPYAAGKSRASSSRSPCQ